VWRELEESPPLGALVEAVEAVEVVEAEAALPASSASLHLAYSD